MTPSLDGKSLKTKFAMSTTPVLLFGAKPSEASVLDATSPCKVFLRLEIGLTANLWKRFHFIFF